MLPASTGERKQRDSTSGRPDGRTVEIQRLIGRSLRGDRRLRGARRAHRLDRLRRAAGRRRHALRGDLRRLRRDASRARPLVEPASCAELPLTAGVAAVSCGIVDGDAGARPRLQGGLHRRGRPQRRHGRGRAPVEVQGTAEGQPFDRAQLDAPARARRVGHAAHRGGAAAGGRRPAMSRLRAVLATGNAGKAPSCRACSAATSSARPIEVDETPTRTRERAAQGAPPRPRPPAADRRSATTPGSRSPRSAVSRAAFRPLGGSDRRRPQRRAARAPDGAADRSRRLRVRARRGRCPTGARSWSRARCRGRDRGGAARRRAGSATTRSSCPRATRAPSRS